MAAKSFFGMDGFVWAYGVVEDRKDPLFLGRCKVRWFGWHPEDKTKVPTEDLPWATPVAPLDPGRAHAVGPKEGDWIFGFFRDGVRAQQPVMVGVMMGIPEKKADPSKGFNDPRPDSVLVGHQVPREPEKLKQFDDGSGNDITEISPKSRFPDDRFLKESDLSRYERGYEDPDAHIEKTIVPLKKENIKIGQTDVPTGGHPPGTGSDQPSPATTWTEPETPYAAEYPYNHVYFSEGGHITEIDDTPNAERLHYYHRSGTFEEIHPTGLKVSKVVDKEYHIVLESFFEHIEANSWETVDWGKKTFVNKDKKKDCNYDLTVGANSNINITTEKGEANFFINGDVNIFATGNVNLTCLKDLVAQVGRNANVKVKGNMVTEVDKDMQTHIHGNLKTIVDGNEFRQIGGNQITMIGGNATRTIWGSLTDTVAVTCKRSVIGEILDHSDTSINLDAPLITNTAKNGEIRQFASVHKLNSDIVTIDCQTMQRNCQNIQDMAKGSFDLVATETLLLSGNHVKTSGQNITSIAAETYLSSGANNFRKGIIIGDRGNLICFDSIPYGGAPHEFPNMDKDQFDEMDSTPDGKIYCFGKKFVAKTMLVGIHADTVCTITGLDIIEQATLGMYHTAGQLLTMVSAPSTISANGNILG